MGTCELNRQRTGPPTRLLPTSIRPFVPHPQPPCSQHPNLVEDFFIQGMSHKPNSSSINTVSAPQNAKMPGRAAQSHTRWVFTPGHAVSITTTYLRKASKNNDKPWCPYGDANSSSTTSLHRTAVGNIESRRIDASIPAVASSDMQIRTRSRGQPTEVPPRSSMQR